MRVMAVSVLLLTFVGVSFAQVPKGNVFVGYSYLSEDINSSSRPNLNGWEGSLEGKVLPFIGIVADGSGHYVTTRVFTCPFPPGGGCLSAANGSLYTALLSRVYRPLSVGSGLSLTYWLEQPPRADPVPTSHWLRHSEAEPTSELRPCWAGAC